jgi:hypothetical protein
VGPIALVVTVNPGKSRQLFFSEHFGGFVTTYFILRSLFNRIDRLPVDLFVYNFNGFMQKMKLLKVNAASVLHRF